MSHFTKKTKHADISIISRSETLELRSGSEALQSVINLKHPEKIELKNLEFMLGILLFISAPQKILLLGTGAGSLIHFLRKHYAASHLTSLDIDAELIELMQARMLLPQADQHLNYIVDDAAHYLGETDDQFDLILVDLFIGNKSPHWLLDANSMQLLFEHLSPQGGVAYNLLIESDHDFNHYYRGLRQIFSQKTLCLPVEGFDNTITYAFRTQPAQREMTGHMQQALEMTQAQDINYMEILSTIYTTNPTGSGVI